MEYYYNDQFNRLFICWDSNRIRTRILLCNSFIFCSGWSQTIFLYEKSLWEGVDEKVDKCIYCNSFIHDIDEQQLAKRRVSEKLWMKGLHAFQSCSCVITLHFYSVGSITPIPASCREKSFWKDMNGGVGWLSKIIPCHIYQNVSLTH